MAEATREGRRGARACDRCIARAWMIGRLAGHIDRVRARVGDVLTLQGDELLAAVGGREQDTVRCELESLDVAALRARAAETGLEAICQCDLAYPVRVRMLEARPAVLYVAGGLDRLLELVAADPVAIVGSRRPSAYGLDMAHSLGRGLARSGVTVVSGMALGIDSAAHAGALEADGPTVAVLPGSPDKPYPRGKRVLHRRILAAGAAVSELGPGNTVWRWMFPARNRIIAALAAITVVVEAGDRSGALLTAGLARGLARPVGAVPGRVTSPQAAGPNGLLALGAHVVRGPQDVLDLLFGAGVRRVGDDRHRDVPAELRPVLAAIADGHDTAVALERVGFEVDRGLVALAALELGGFVRRGAGGRFTVLP